MLVEPGATLSEVPVKQSALARQSTCLKLIDHLNTGPVGELSFTQHTTLQIGRPPLN